jgi:nucleoside-diphosphate-sugar epimerase
MQMKVFITGATGFIGGSIAHRLMQNGHQLTGLVRSKEKSAELLKLGIGPVLGTLDDREVITKAARSADAVVNAADSDHRGVVETLVGALQGSNKALLHIGGSSIVADYAAGEPSEHVFDERIYEEGSTFTPVAELAARVAIDHLVLDAAKRQIRSAVICPCLIYGTGKGLHADSIQVPLLIAMAKKGVTEFVVLCQYQADSPLRITSLSVRLCGIASRT